MKRILLLTVIAVFVMMPFASFAKTAISDSELGAVTAQTGVTIDFTDFRLGSISIGTISWGDNGFGSTYTGEGWVGQSLTLSDNAVNITGTMDIDVGTSGNRTAIGIKLPTINVTGNVEMVVKLAADKTLTTNAGILGTSYISGLSINPSGTLIIYAH
ncbi:hypothetical protein ASZ90_007696 [hydrocarbon metagenome]|uniref:DUF6160 domain-containing protein n=1 Tax=hydrocarbon metagenome TaxID=938273 RepID=A0A0W8FNN0_9ZZZZ